jgi:hypothetical protein
MTATKLILVFFITLCLCSISQAQIVINEISNMNWQDERPDPAACTRAFHFQNLTS